MADPAAPKKARQDLSLDQIREAVQRALVGATPAGAPVPYICQLYPDRVVVEMGGGYFERPFTLGDEGTASLGEPKQVEATWAPVKQGQVSISTCFVRQAVSPREFEIVVIREGFAVGTGKDGRYYRDGRPLHWAKQAIESAVEVYEGAPVTAFRFGDAFAHLPDGPDRMKALAAMNQIGRLSRVRVEQAADGRAELRARLTLLDGVDPVVPAILAEWADEKIPMSERGGFSIEAVADFQAAIVEGVAVTQGVCIRRNPDGPSLDMVSHPAAGGRVLKVAASIHGGTPMPDPAPKPDAAATAVLEDAGKITQSAKDALARLAEKEKALNIRDAAAKVKQACDAAKLPAEQAALVTDHFAGREEVPDADLKAKVEQAQKALQSSGIVTMPGAGISFGLESRDKLEMEIEGLLSRSSDPAWAAKRKDGKNIRQALSEAGLDRPVSFLAHFRERTGHDFVRTKFASSLVKEKVRQAINVAAYGDAFENVLNRRFLTFFENPDYSAWRRIVSNVVQLPNYVKQERITVGSYANPPAVAEGANYTEATTPGDTGNGYTPVKYGFTESITEEAFLRDDVGILASVPMRMGTAMARLVYETVFDVVKPSTTATMDYDGETLYDTDHDVNQNKRTTALDATEFIAIAKLMMKFVDQTSSKVMGLRPAKILVPIDLANTAWDIFKPLANYPGGATTDNAWLREFGVEVIVVRHWTDATDFAVGADPATAPGIEVGFVGSETPEFFVQDNKTLGSVFDADKILYKSKIAFGANVGRHESWHGSVVAG